MTNEQAMEALKGFAVIAIGKNGNKFFIEIGNCGRNFDKVRKFQAANLETIVEKIKKTFN